MNLEDKSRSIHLSELMYLCFFGIMFFAKGIGLYDGQPIYKLVLLAAFGCLGVKMLITKHSYLEWTVILGLLGFSAFIYLHSGEKGILICTATVVAMKKVSVDRVFKTGLILWCISAGGCFLYALLNMDTVRMEVQHKLGRTYVPRYFMGFPHPNVLHISYFVLVLLLLYAWKENYNWKHLLGLMLGNVFVFIYSFSITGFSVVTFLLVLAAYIKIKKINNFDYFLVKAVFPLCLLISIVLPVLAEGKVLQIADKIFNHRIGYSKHFLQWDMITLIGNPLAEITDNILAIDNSFVFALIIYGVPIFLSLVLVYFALIKSYADEKKNMELAIVISYFIAGITEPLLFNTSFKNMTLIFLGAFLFEKLEKYSGKEVAFIKEKDLEFKVPINYWQRIKMPFENIGQYMQTRYVYISLAAALVISVVYAIIRDVPQRILERRKEEIESLIFFERIRSGVTMFVFLYALLIVILCLNRYRKNKVTIQP